MSENPTDPKPGLAPPRLEDYADYVEHPRFGKGPRYTGLDPRQGAPDVRLPYRLLYWPEEIISGTAIKADLSRQTYSFVPVTHYYDLDRSCVDCKRRFLFFAEEQKHWYEELGFPLDSDAIRCPLCRKRLQNEARKREPSNLLRRRFETLLAQTSRSVEETLELMECCLTLIEKEIFPPRQCERIRMFLKRLPEASRSEERFQDVTARLHAVESKFRRPASEDASV